MSDNCVVIEPAALLVSTSARFNRDQIDCSTIRNSVLNVFDTIVIIASVSAVGENALCSIVFLCRF